MKKEDGMDSKIDKRIISSKLYKYCECLNNKDYAFDPAIGREKELESLMISILTPNKSTIITGNPGVGKTSIIEGLAYRIKQGNVPNALKDYIILQTSATVLNSNCCLSGMLEKRILELFNLLKDEKNIILFIDEIHTLIGTGKNADNTSLDIANMIKPFITSNDICLIGATTINEYSDFIQSDKAFERRFQNILLKEPSKEALEKILKYTISKYSTIYNITINKDFLNLISKNLAYLTDKEHKNLNHIMYNPDLAISIIENAFGYARLYDKKEITVKEFAKAYNSSDKVRGKFKMYSNCNDTSKSANNICYLPNIKY